MDGALDYKEMKLKEKKKLTFEMWINKNFHLKLIFL